MRDASTAGASGDMLSVETPTSVLESRKQDHVKGPVHTVEDADTNASSISKRIKKINKIFSKPKKEKKSKKEKKEKKKEKKDKKDKKKKKKKSKKEKEGRGGDETPRPDATETEAAETREAAPKESENLMIPYLPSRRKDTIKSYEADNEGGDDGGGHESRTGQEEETSHTGMTSTRPDETTLMTEEDHREETTLDNSLGDTADTECNYSAPARMQDMENFYPLVLPEPLAAAAITAGRQAPWSPPPPPPRLPRPPPATTTTVQDGPVPSTPMNQPTTTPLADSLQTQTETETFQDLVTLSTVHGPESMKPTTIFGTPWCTMKEFWNSCIFLDEAKCTQAYQLATQCGPMNETTCSTGDSMTMTAKTEGTPTTDKAVIKFVPKAEPTEPSNDDAKQQEEVPCQEEETKQDEKLMAPTLLGNLLNEGETTERPVPVPLDMKPSPPKQEVAKDSRKVDEGKDAKRMTSPATKTELQAAETSASTSVPDIAVDSPTGAPAMHGAREPAAVVNPMMDDDGITEEPEPTGYTDPNAPSEYQEQGMLILSSDGQPTYSALTNEEEYTYLTESEDGGTTVEKSVSKVSKAKSSKHSKMMMMKAISKAKSGSAAKGSAVSNPDSVAKRLKAARNKAPPKELSSTPKRSTPTEEEKAEFVATAEFLTSRKEAQMKEMERLKAKRRHFKNMQKQRGCDEIERARLNQAFSSDEESEEEKQPSVKDKKKEEKEDKKVIAEKPSDDSLGAMIKDALTRADRTIDFVLENNYNDYASEALSE